MNSQVETTIRNYYPTGTFDNVNRALVKGSDRKLYPHNPASDYVSRFSDVPNGYLGCCFSSNLFQVCPKTNFPKKKIKFFQDL